MSRIHVLPVDLRNKIAAGEVVERPASVVKELIENSIDAGSTEITVEVLNGGKRLIRVDDNGTGMDREEALLALERHATSKISSFDDLFRISTLGFRGEALPSIASVSKVRLQTGRKGSAGTDIVIEGGEVKSIRESGVSGTSFEAGELFYNTPARKKFLKTTQTELFHIIETVTRKALSHPSIGFRLVTDRQETMNLARAASLRERILQVFGIEFLEGLIEVSAEADAMRLTSFVSKTDCFRGSKSHQYLFINQRAVKDPSLSHAVYRAYEGILPSDRHPIFFLYLELPPQKVDFNVHPTKREVRFEEKEAVYRFVLASLRDRVSSDRRAYAQHFLEPGPQEHAGQSFRTYGPGTTGAASPAAPAMVAEAQEFGYQISFPSLYLGDTFVAFSGRGGLTILDHHAAHERILFEKLLKGMRSLSRQLLFPKQVRLQSREHRAVLQQRDSLLDLGIELDDFGRDTVIVRAVPEEIFDADIAAILSDLAARILEGATPEKPLLRDLAARIACHQSVRGRRSLSPAEVARLVHDLEQTDHPDQCPHGRPTRIFYSLNDLNKLFKRK
ncbi:MAG: DNA mismatch repair endonuclease MutL [Thermodesulfovibrionales bacterium]